MEYYYTHRDNIYIDKGLLIFRDSSFKHITKVLRKKRGDIINATDGENNVYVCEIIKIKKNLIEAEILKNYKDIGEPEKNVTMYICQLKSNDRFEFAIEKAVEIGVKKIIPVISQNTIVKKKYSSDRIKRFNRIILSAMEQSQRCYLPLMEETVTFEEMLDFTNTVKSKIVMYEFEKPSNKIIHSKINNDCVLLLGPEGGFNKSEINELKINNWMSFSLGDRKLRSETAAILSLYEILKT
jgi:16S rRNA (uracil1498-N3)-methyltransferase